MSAPIDAAARPLPSELTTPPVTNRYFVFFVRFTMRLPFLRPREDGSRALQIFRRVHPEPAVRRLDPPDPVPPLERPQLLERLLLLEAPGGERRERLQERLAEGVDAHVRAREGALTPRAAVRDGGPRKIERVARGRAHDLHDVRPLELALTERAGERRHLDRGILHRGEEPLDGGGLDERLVALQVHHDPGPRRELPGGLRDAVRARARGPRHDGARPAAPRGGGDALVVRRDRDDID